MTELNLDALKPVSLTDRLLVEVIRELRIPRHVREKLAESPLCTLGNPRPEHCIGDYTTPDVPLPDGQE